MVRRSDVPMKDRKETPALRARPLRSYVSAAFHSERERVRQRYITVPDRLQKGKNQHVQESIHGYELRRQRERS